MAGYGFGNQPAGAAAGVLLAYLDNSQDGASSCETYHRTNHHRMRHAAVPLVGFTCAQPILQGFCRKATGRPRSRH